MSTVGLDYLPGAFQAITAEMNDPAILLDMHNRIVWLNPASERLFGLEHEHSVGTPVESIWPGWLVPPGAVRAQQVAFGQGSDRRDYELSVSPIRKEGAEQLGWMLFLHDPIKTRPKESVSEEPRDDLSQNLADYAANSTADLHAKIDEYERREAALLQENRELLSIQSATALTASSLDLQFVLETVTWEMAGLLKVERCAIYEWEPESDLVSRIAEYDSQEPDGNAVSYNLADYPTRARALTEKFTWQLVANQPGLDPAELAYMNKAGIKTLLFLPLVFQERIVGLIEVSDGRVPRSFSDREISLAQMLSTQIAGAIENARLFRRSQEEIARRLAAEEKVTTSLREKEVLLKEIHHRVKNNLQTVSSILNLQSRTLSDPAVQAVFRDSQARVRTMALIHEKLYRSEDLNRISFAEYGHSLASYLIRSYQIPSRRVHLNVDRTDVLMDIDTAVPCGLIINELVTNSLKYAFPSDPDSPEGRIDGTRDEIRITMVQQADQCLQLTVSDTGVGFPQDLDFRETGSLGLRLVNTLVDQLEGTIELSYRDGACFEITFPA